MPRPGLAIVAGRGELPRLLAEDCAARGRPYRVVEFDGVPLDWTAGQPLIRARFEKPGRLFASLRAAGITEVVFAGGMSRPPLRLLAFDLKMLRLAPRLLPGLRSGDDTTLRMIAAIFEGEGFTVRAAHEILTDLPAPEGVLGRTRPSELDRADADRAAAIVAALGGVDVGQAAVVADGICLGLESIQGTDALLDFVARTPPALRPTRARGVLYKAPKPDQDRRLDLPAIGPATVERAAAAGLAGIAVEAGGVMVLGYAATVAAGDAAGLFLWARGPAA
ncbi:MAG: UDP-2,3-diacylglucosamine diphosphatase LpxI [Amaricoccus sp.]